MPSKVIIGLSVVISISILVVVFASVLGDKSIASAQVVDMDEPPTNATEELDVKIDATEPLPVNGTIEVDITEADDIDIDAIPPEGVSIVVTNTTLTVTNNPVEITEGGASGTPSGTEGLDAGTSAPGGNENDVEQGSGPDDDPSGDGGGGDEPTDTGDAPDDENEEEE